MKKLLLVVVCCFMLCGCGNNINIGNDLRIVKIKSKYSIVGSFSNKTKDCGIYNVSFKLQNGDIIKYYKTIIPVSVDDNIYEFCVDIKDNGLNNISNLEEYQIEINNIKCSN